jgi:dipeptide/tripeptide permease
MISKSSALIVIVLALTPPVIVPIIAFVMVGKEHMGWAIGGGLALGIVLSIVGVAVFIGYNELAQEEEKKQSQEKAVREAVSTGSAVDIAIVNMKKLDQYYTLNRNQARNSFMAGMVAVCIGFVAILISARFASDSKQAIPGALSGVLLNFIGGGFFVMYNKSIAQLNLFYGKLVQLQDTMLAVQQCDKLPHEKSADVRQSIILELIHRPVSGQVQVAAPSSAHGRSRIQNRRPKPKQEATPAQGASAGAG